MRKIQNLLLSVGFELPYEWFHLVAGVVYVFFGVLGGFYALRALRSLHRSPEMLRSQRNIWLPILFGGAVFTVSGIFYFTEYSYFSSFNLNPEINLLRDASCVVGFLLLNIGVIRYSRLQIEYDKLKREALQMMSYEHKQ